MCLFQTFLQKAKETGVNQFMDQRLKVKSTWMFNLKHEKCILCKCGVISPNIVNIYTNRNLY